MLAYLIIYSISADAKECCKDESCCENGQGACHKEEAKESSETKACGCKAGEDCKCSDGKCGC